VAVFESHPARAFEASIQRNCAVGILVKLDIPALVRYENHEQIHAVGFGVTADELTQHHFTVAEITRP
jgi:hypothetical protein